MGLYTMSFNVAFAVGPWLGASVLGKWGATTMWVAAFVSGCISTLDDELHGAAQDDRITAAGAGLLALNSGGRAFGDFAERARSTWGKTGTWSSNRQ